jgi:hypothetical protein
MEQRVLAVQSKQQFTGARPSLSVTVSGQKPADRTRKVVSVPDPEIPRISGYERYGGHGRYEIARGGLSRLGGETAREMRQTLLPLRDAALPLVRV